MAAIEGLQKALDSSNHEKNVMLRALQVKNSAASGRKLARMSIFEWNPQEHTQTEMM